MSNRTASGLYVVGSHERIGPHRASVAASARKVRLWMRLKAGGRVRPVVTDNEEVATYRVTCEQMGWEIVKEELV